jgi:hypothetical protein
MEEFGRGTRFQGREYYFRRGVAFSMIGSGFAARIHRHLSVFGNMGSSVFPSDVGNGRVRYEYSARPYDSQFPEPRRSLRSR